MQDFFINVLKVTGGQILGIFGIFFLLGFILSTIQKLVDQKYMRVCGWKGILWTAWLGTPIHEFSHIIFAKIFRHKIERIAIFQPNKETGGLGQVDHSYSSNSIYQRMGNFFVGSSPLIFGAFFLVGLLYLLVPNGNEIFSPIRDISSQNLLLIISPIKETLFNLFRWQNLTSWPFWLFLYISFAIASHMGPSPADQKNMWRGLFWIILILFIINLITLLLGQDITKYILYTNKYLGIFTAIFIYAIIISSLHYIIISILFYPFIRPKR